MSRIVGTLLGGAANTVEFLGVLFLFSAGLVVLVFLSLTWDWRILPAAFALLYGSTYLLRGDGKPERFRGLCILAVLP